MANSGGNLRSTLSSSPPLPAFLPLALTLPLLIDTMNIRYFPGWAKYLSKQQFRALMCRCKGNVCRANTPPSREPLICESPIAPIWLIFRCIDQQSSVSMVETLGRSSPQSKLFDYHCPTLNGSELLCARVFVSVSDGLELLEENETIACRTGIRAVLFLDGISFRGRPSCVWKINGNLENSDKQRKMYAFALKENRS